jgi:hypothetical protein
VGFHLGFGGAPTGKGFLKVKEYLESGDLPPVEVEERHERVLPIAQTLSHARRLSQCNEGQTYLDEKGLSREVPCGWLSERLPWFRDGHPLVVPLFSGRGELKSMHGRAVDSSSKTLPAGMESAGLLMLDPRWARPWVRGGLAPDRVFLVEGFTDYLAMSLDGPAIGCQSGSFTALRLLPWSPSVTIYSCMHSDEAGFSYEEKIARELWPRRVARLPIDRVMG